MKIKLLVNSNAITKIQSFMHLKLLILMNHGTLKYWMKYQVTKFLKHDKGNLISLIGILLRVFLLEK
jgi:hypothetical protein